MFSGKKIAKQVKRKPFRGEFSLDEKQLSWIRCREYFLKSFNENHKGLFFSYREEEYKNVINFLNKTEEILIFSALQSFEKSKFFETNLNFAIWIEPSKFWMKCFMKRSLLTIFLRCGLNYRSNYEEALFSLEHTRKTKLAIKRFLYGFTNYSSKCKITRNKGWVSLFKNKSKQEICNYLVVPNHVYRPSCMIGMGDLWN